MQKSGSVPPSASVSSRAAQASQRGDRDRRHKKKTHRCHPLPTSKSQQVLSLQDKETTVVQPDANMRRLTCLRLLKEADFAKLGCEKVRIGVNFDRACELLDSALILIEYPMPVEMKAKRLGEISRFMGLRMSMHSGTLSQKQARIIAPLIARLQQQLCQFCEEVQAQSPEYDPSDDALEKPSKVKAFNRIILDSDVKNLAIYALSLPENISPLGHQLRTLWTIHSYFEKFQQVISKVLPDFDERPDLGFGMADLHICRIYMLDRVQQINEAREPLPKEAALVLENKSQWLASFADYHDLWHHLMMTETLPTLLKSAERPNARVQLNDKERMQLCFRLAKTGIKFAGIHTPTVNEYLLEKNPNLLTPIEKQAVQEYQERRRCQRLEIKAARDFAFQARELGLGEHQQAELHLNFAITYERVGNIPAAHLHLMLGARIANESLHHLALVCSLWLDDSIHPFTPCKAVRLWQEAQSRNVGDVQPLPSKAIRYAGKENITAAFVELLRTGQCDDSILTETHKQLATALQYIAKGEYQNAIFILKPMGSLLPVLNALTGYCAAQLIESHPEYLESALENFRKGFNDGCLELGLEFARLAVTHKRDTAEAIEKLKLAIQLFWHYDLYEEVEECYRLLGILHSSQPQKVYADKAESRKSKLGKSKKHRRLHDGADGSKPCTDSVQQSVSQSKGQSKDQVLATVSDGSSSSSDVSGCSATASSTDESSDTDSDFDPSNIMGGVAAQAVADKTQEGKVCPQSYRLTSSLLTTVNDHIQAYEFDKADQILLSVKVSDDRALNGRLAQTRAWLLRRRYICNEPESRSDGKLCRNVCLDLLDRGRQLAEKGIRNMGISGALSRCSSQMPVVKSLSTKERRALASLYAELGHFYRELAGFTFDLRHIETGRQMSNVADDLNPSRRFRSESNKIAGAAKVQVVSPEYAALLRSSMS